MFGFYLHKHQAIIMVISTKSIYIQSYEPQQQRPQYGNENIKIYQHIQKKTSIVQFLYNIYKVQKSHKGVNNFITYL